MPALHRELVANHPVHIVAGFFTSRELWVVMEYMDAGALTDVVLYTHMSENQVQTRTHHLQDQFDHGQFDIAIHRSDQPDL